jgi:hypothetical protein
MTKSRRVWSHFSRVYSTSFAGKRRIKIKKGDYPQTKPKKGLMWR